MRQKELIILFRKTRHDVSKHNQRRAQQHRFMSVPGIARSSRKGAKEKQKEHLTGADPGDGRRRGVHRVAIVCLKDAEAGDEAPFDEESEVACEDVEPGCRAAVGGFAGLALGNCLEGDDLASDSALTRAV